MALIYLVRHAEPTLRGVFLGSSDPPLSPTGLAQAQALSLPPLPIYASPLRRAVETLNGRPATILPGLAEIDYGPWDGFSWSEIESRFPTQAAAKLADWTGFDIPGAEPWSAFTSRIAQTLPLCPPPAIILAHLAVNSVIHSLLTGSSPLTFQQNYAEIVTLES
ncbi:MAG: histidine phosphatase family protein [Acidobacteriota bacterium]